MTKAQHDPQKDDQKKASSDDKNPAADDQKMPDQQDDLMAKVAAAQSQDDELKMLLARIEELERQVGTLKDSSARAQAELQNAKIRLDKESSDMRKFASELALRRLLPTIDNFQRAFKHLPEDLASQEWVKGVSAIEQDLMKQVVDLGLKPIESLGQPVDTNKHEVLMEGPGEKGKVIEVFEDGYELHGKILRAAKVRVGNGEK